MTDRNRTVYGVPYARVKVPVSARAPAWLQAVLRAMCIASELPVEHSMLYKYSLRRPCGTYTQHGEARTYSILLTDECNQRVKMSPYTSHDATARVRLAWTVRYTGTTAPAAQGARFGHAPPVCLLGSCTQVVRELARATCIECVCG